MMVVACLIVSETTAELTGSIGAVSRAAVLPFRNAGNETKA